ncbi:endonuclease/exonuclease/phosphatase family protein [Shewanella sp. TC10]|uniref:endonuclease/exonuclease/phosphatase family protein n=1 Tax=Shewanella sp. TC10 TaxID=1419739 RepID=UPI00129DC11B|nr:endonuclease/exonuclease/phosphatase family protein [Shewanella sp. TC10]
MKVLQTATAFAVSALLLMGCNSNNDDFSQHTQPDANKSPEVINDIRIGAYNLSFDRNNFTDLIAEMSLTVAQQDALIKKWFDKSLIDKEKTLAEKVIQIRNVAAIIQTKRPAVLLMSEFNNDGIAENAQALQGFQLNYLSVPQNTLGSTSETVKTLEPIEFGYVENFATNTGLLSGYDLNHDGKIALPADAWGFGVYHGQYAFSLVSQFPIDTDKIRTFQHFKWKDMPGETNPVISNCQDKKYPIPAGKACGDNWYSDAAWAEKPMSSKNHVDAPIIVPTANGDKVIHLLMSHPTPPVFDTVTENNKLLNRAEIKFWHDYISGTGSYIYDDEGKKGGINNQASFVILGDLNADPLSGDGYLDTIKDLMNNHRVNQDATHGNKAPRSLGGPECFSNNECRKDNRDLNYSAYITSTSGLRLDHIIPSSDLNVTGSGVFWPTTSEQGHLMMKDPRVGKWGGGSKSVSSDHRLVWIDVKL